MIRVFIDGKEADIDAATTVSVSLSVASISEPETGKVGYTKTIELPATPHNREIMGDSDCVNSPDNFNRLQHKARTEADGFTVMEGVAYLLSSEVGGNGEGCYRMSIIGAGKEWASKAAETPFREIGVEFSEAMTGVKIAESWSWNKPVRFLPVQRDKFYPDNPSSNLFPPAKILTFEDYHPFIHAKSVLERIFAEAGYSLSSEFIAGEFFDSLYMSGNYPTKNTDTLKDKMDFMAGRFASETTVADYRGRVYATPFSGNYTIGNIVDTADPDEESGGVKIDGVFTYNDCFTKIGGRIAFVPPHEVTLGFEYSIYYTTDYYMESREHLCGIDCINLDEEQDRIYKIANRNIDRRDEIGPGRAYVCIVFGHADGDSYRLMYHEQRDGGELVPVSGGIFSARTGDVAIISSYEVSDPVLQVKKAGTSVYTEYEDDWALYDGYVTERGRVDVEIVVRSAPERILPSQPKYFDLIYFRGAEPGATFTIGSQTKVRPVFSTYPSEGSSLEFGQVAAHDFTALDFINGLKHMFNLCFYTDELSKTVFVEPREAFYRSDEIVDWSDRIDYGKPGRILEPAAGIARNQIFRYATGDGAVMRWNARNGDTLGSWSATVGNAYAKDSVKTYENPIFTASLNVTGDYPDALAASLVQAGDRDQDADMRSEELNFPAKIVRYLGMKNLPQGQSWGWPGNAGSYPFLAFHHEGTGEGSFCEPDSEAAFQEGFTLCFEDRDGLPGLHQFYGPNIDFYNYGRRVELYLALRPEDVEPFISPNRLMRDFRGLWRLTVGGETALFRLEEICDYYASRAGSTKCVFIKEG